MKKGNQPSAPQPPPFTPINIGQAQNLFEQYTKTGFDMGDADLRARFPGLIAQRNKNIAADYKALTGPLDPTLQNKFSSDALARGFAAFGGSGPGSSIGPVGSAGRGAISGDIARQTSDYQDIVRKNFAQDITDNPERSLTLGGDDLVNLAIGNLMGQNQAAYQGYAGAVSGGNAANAAQAQQTASTIGTIISIIGLAMSDVRLKHNIIYLGLSPRGHRIYEFSYLGTTRRWIGALAHEVRRKTPHAVLRIGRFLAVNYRLIDVPFVEVSL